MIHKNCERCGHMSKWSCDIYDSADDKYNLYDIFKNTDCLVFNSDELILYHIEYLIEVNGKEDRMWTTEICKSKDMTDDYGVKGFEENGKRQISDDFKIKEVYITPILKSGKYEIEGFKEIK